jgi:hypothetical protein
MKDKKIYTVWVGGVEVNDYHLNWSDAYRLFRHWIDKGYHDVIIEEVN